MVHLMATAAPPMTSTTLPAPDPELIEAGASGHLVIMVGAGASFESGLPSWGRLLESLFAQAQTKATPEQAEELNQAKSWFAEKGDLLEKASLLRQVMGEPWVAGVIAADMRRATATPTAIHRALAAIPGAAFLTTNYDTLLEAAIAERTGTRPRVVLLSNVEGIRDFCAGQVLKLHGDIDAPETIVLSSEDFFRVSHQAAPAWKHRLQGLLQGAHKLLLVGYGYGDVDVQEVVDELRGAYGDKLPGPFWLQKEDVRTRAKAKACGLRPVWLRDHSDVAPWLEVFARAIEAQKAQAPAVLKAIAYAEKVRELFKGEQEQAGRLFEEEKYQAAEDTYRNLLGQVEALVAADPQSDELKRVIASSQVNIGSCLLCQQRSEEARSTFRQAAETAENLSTEGRLILVEGLAQLDERERARAVLEHISPSSEKERVHLEDVRQLVDVLDGCLPEGERPTSSSTLSLRTAQLLLEQGRLDMAARKALSAIGTAPKHALVRLYSLTVIEKALGRSILEKPGDKGWVPVAEREQVVTIIEQGLQWLDGKLTAPRLRRDFEQLRLSFARLTQDEERVDTARAALQAIALDSHASPSAEALAFHRACDLAEAGKLDEALQQLPPSSEHPWARAFEHAYLKSVAQRFDEALSDTLDLVRRFPGRAQIEYLTAKLLLRASRPEEALPHARAAFEALPGRGYRILLGQCLILAGRHAEAAKVLEPLADSNHPQLLRARAQAVEPTDPAQAAEIWRRYIRVYPEDLMAHLRVAHLLFKLGRSADAATAGWQLFEVAKDRLPPQMLYQCAQLQRLDGTFGTEAQKRVEMIAKTLEVRFPDNLEAEQHRLLILTELGFPTEARPVNYTGLAEAGFLRTKTLDEFKESLRHGHELRQAVLDAYRLGHLPFESFCELGDTKAAVFLSGVVRLAEDRSSIVLSTPVAFGATLPSLAGQRILAGELELLLLQHLGLLGNLRDALKPGGKLILFRDVWERMVASAAELEVRTQRLELAEQEHLWERLHSIPKVKLEEDASTTPDPEWARERGLPFLDGEAMEGGARLSPRALVAHLQEQGYLDRDQVDLLLRTLPPEDEPLPALPAPMPARFAITYAPLQSFFSADAFEALLESVPDGLVVGPETMRVLRNWRKGLRQAVYAAELATAAQRAVGAGIAEGWVDASFVRPSISDLPDVRDTQDVEEARRLYREPLAQSLSFRQALVDDPELWLLTADYFVTSAMGDHINLVQALAWPDGRAYLELAKRMLGVISRAVDLPSFVIHLMPESQHWRMLCRLAEFGFASALRPESLLDLTKQYGSLAKVEPKRLLDRAEWMAHELQHNGWLLASIRLADAYAKTIWEAFRRVDSPDAENSKLTDAETRQLMTTLLGRLEKLEEAKRSGALVLGLRFLAIAAASKPRLAFEASVRNNDHGVLALESPPARLWSSLQAWAGLSGPRRASYAHAVRETWVFLDQLTQPAGATPEQSAPLLLAVLVSPSNPIHPEIAAPAVLSANWKYRPLQFIQGKQVGHEGVESKLQAGAARLEHGDGFNESVFVLHGANGNVLPLPVEAVLLRLNRSGSAFKEAAKDLARFQGPHDGRAYTLLTALAQSPEDDKLRRDYARLAVLAPWRLVREDPSMLQSWAQMEHSNSDAIPSDIAELRKMLSEPDAALPIEQDPGDILFARIQEGGHWAERRDVWDLARQACEVPGVLPSFVLHMRLRQDKESFAQAVSEALHRLTHPQEYPSARLAGDVFFLRVAADRRPYVSLPGGEIDLRERLPERFLFLLRSILDEDKQTALRGSNDQSPKNGRPETFADAEASLLRVCGQVVRDLAHGQLLPLKDGLWLTYRLFQWLCAQLEGISPDERTAGVRALREVAPPSEKLAPSADDLLNPFGFERGRFDHRLATVIFAFGFMEELLERLPAASYDVTEPASNGASATLDDDVKAPPRAVTSTALEDLLAEVAARPLSEADHHFRDKDDKLSCLNWDGPGALPDLALKALLELNGGAFFLMPAERRLAWILDLPTRRDQHARVTWPLAGLIVATLVNHARKLLPEERVCFEERLRAVEVSAEPNAVLWRWIGFTELYAAGQHHLEIEVAQMLLENLAQVQAPTALGSYLATVALRDSSRLEVEFERVLTRVETTGLDPVPFAGALARVIILGGHEAIREAQKVLQRLAQRPPFQADERMRQLLGTLGML
jgi:tetratricopeptide (TPR) repeat protein